MRLIFSGKTKEFTPDLEERFTAKLAKLSKFVERRGEREAHIVHQMERRTHKVEVVMNFHDHSLIGVGSDTDLDTALTEAAAKLEKQVLKLRNRWRDTHRDAKSVRSSKESWDTAPTTPEVTRPAKPPAKGKANGRVTKPKIFKVTYNEDRKPMTVEEAILEMDSDLSYFVYRDSKRDCLSVLLRRADGHFDLIES